MAKSPLPRIGRIGPKHLQDWYRGCALAIRIASQKDTILVVTNFKTNKESEAEIYTSALKVLKGSKEIKVEVVRFGLETTEEIALAIDIASKRNEELVIISTVLHFPRVWWVSRSSSIVRHRIIFGIPRPREAITDIVLSMTFPVIDMLGLRNTFLKKLKARRQKGML